jgi:hypothetical protein
MQYPTTFEEAEAFESFLATLVAENKANASKPRSAETLAVLKKIQQAIPVGSYRHFKGGMYSVLGVREDVNTGLCYVEYVAEYGVYKGELALRILVGGNDSFSRVIVRTKYRGVRFVRIAEEVVLDA